MEIIFKKWHHRVPSDAKRDCIGIAPTTSKGKEMYKTEGNATNEI